MLQQYKSTMNVFKVRFVLQSVNSVASLSQVLKGTHRWGADASLQYRSLTGFRYPDLLSKHIYVKQPQHRFNTQMNQCNLRETGWQADAASIPCSGCSSEHHSACIAAPQVGRCICMAALFTDIANNLAVPLNKFHSTVDISLVIADGQSGSCAAAKVFFESSALSAA